MMERAKANAMRSGVVVIGALAFGYLSLQLGFKPFLERAQQQQQLQQEAVFQQQPQLADEEASLPSSDDR